MPTDKTPMSEGKPPAKRRSGAILGAALGALVAVFAVLNAQSVEVNWIVSATRTPLIVVIVLFLLIGFASGAAFASRRGGHRRGKR